MAKRKPSKKPQQARTITKQKKFLEYLMKNDGVVYAACAEMGIDNSTVYSWLSLYPDFALAVDAMKYNIVDLAEEVIRQHTKKGSLDAAKFTVKMKGRKRGWTETQNIDITSGGDKIKFDFNFGTKDETTTEE